MKKSAFPCAELHIVDKSKIDCEYLPEASHIADIINKLVAEKMPVKTKSGYRPVMYKDICILMRGLNEADDYFDALTKKNVSPCIIRKMAAFPKHRNKRDAVVS